jgi:phospholipid-translocating ATPase
VSSIAVIVANFFVMTSLYSFTWIQLFIIWISILVYYAFVCIYAQFNTFIFAGHDVLFGTGCYWMMLILTIVACFLPRISAMHFLHQYYPYDNDIVREQELVLHNGRSSYAQPQQGPGSSLETKCQTEDDKAKRCSVYDNSSSSANYPPLEELPNSVA